MSDFWLGLLIGIPVGMVLLVLAFTVMVAWTAMDETWRWEEHG